jgi:hypothetical protein
VRQVSRTSSSLSINMPFLAKERCTQPRVLSASHCPSHECVHDICQYPIYYDPLYFPDLHPFVFETESSFSVWFLNRVQNHSLECCSCLQLPGICEMSDANVCCIMDCIEIDVHSVRFHVPLRFVEAASFTFCRMFRFFQSYLAMLQTMTTTLGQWATDAEAAILEIPSWFMSSEDDILRRVSFSSAPSVLRSVAQSLYHYPVHTTKSQLERLIVDDFVRERIRFWASDVFCDKPWTVYIANHFALRYGESFAHTLRDFRSPRNFEPLSHDVDLRKMYGDLWLALTFDELLSRFSCVPKTDLLNCLHSIPCHLRPLYRVRSIMDCRRSLLRHIHNRLCYLSSLTNRQFFQVFYSVQPCYTDRLSPRPMMTNIILTVEYGVNIISALQTSALTKSDISSD